MLLREDPNKIEEFNNRWNSLKSILLEKDSEYAMKCIEWWNKVLVDSKNEIQENELNKIIKELKHNSNASKEEIDKIYKRRKKYLPKNYPINLLVGDIVHVDFGISYCSELSNGHYGIILTDRIGSLYLVAPLTSTKPKGEYVHYDDLELPSQNNVKDSYVNIGQIRLLSYRRLQNINNVSSGRRHIDTKRVRNIILKYNKIIEHHIKIQEEKEKNKG